MIVSQTFNECLLSANLIVLISLIDFKKLSNLFQILKTR